MSKAFDFSLKRVKRFKEQRLEAEKITLSQLNQQKIELQNKIQACQECLRENALAVRQTDGLKPGELSGHIFVIDNMRRQIFDLEENVSKLDLQSSRQQKVVILAKQELAGLDKLEEKQLEEYSKQMAKENERQISENITNQLSKSTGTKRLQY